MGELVTRIVDHMMVSVGVRVPARDGVGGSWGWGLGMMYGGDSAGVGEVYECPEAYETAARAAADAAVAMRMICEGRGGLIRAIEQYRLSAPAGMVTVSAFQGR